jgi:predicted phage tail protein
MKRKVYLEGELADRFGSELTLNVDSFRDLFRLLSANDPTLHDYFMDCNENNIGFVCKWGENPVEDESELLLQLQEGDMYVSPIPAGSGSDIGKIIVGLVIIAVSLYYPPAVAFLGGAGSTGQLAALYIGATIALAGVAEIMAPDPAVDSADIQNDTSYLFQGSAQTILEGDPVPILYGRLRVPGKPIDFHLRNANSTYLDSSGFGYGFILDDATNNTGAADPADVNSGGGGLDRYDNIGPIVPELPGQNQQFNVSDETDPADVINLGYIQTGFNGGP